MILQDGPVFLLIGSTTTNRRHHHGKKANAENHFYVTFTPSFDSSAVAITSSPVMVVVSVAICTETTMKFRKKRGAHPRIYLFIRQLASVSSPSRSHLMPSSNWTNQRWNFEIFVFLHITRHTLQWSRLLILWIHRGEISMLSVQVTIPKASDLHFRWTLRMAARSPPKSSRQIPDETQNRSAIRWNLMTASPHRVSHPWSHAVIDRSDRKIVPFLTIEHGQTEVVLNART